MQSHTTTEYQQTEIGILPKEWDVVAVNSAMDIYRGGSPRPIQSYLTTSPSGINWIKIGDVGVGAKYIERTDEKIIPEGVKYSREVKSGDFLLSNSMSFGRPYITKISGCIHDGWLVLQNYGNNFDQEFLYYLLSSKVVVYQYIQKASGSSVLNLNKDLVSSVLLVKPSVKEQSKIAKALSDIDSLITKLSQLITKKRNIKEGAMQELLTGKRRLPGFSGQWEEKKLGDSSSLKARIGWQGLTTAEYLDQGKYFLVTGTDFENGEILWDTCHFVEKSRYDQDNNIQLKPNDVLVTKDGTIGKVAFVESLTLPATLNSGVFVIRPKNGCYLPQFLYYILRSSIFDEFLNQLAAGSTISHLYQKDFVHFTFNAPSQLEEQKAISQILSDMEAEIEEHEKQKAKYIDIKQGMMQQLLTGKIRLIRN